MDPNRPVLIGVGLVNQRAADPATAREPLDLMVDAAVAAGADSGAPNLLRAIEAVYVPKGRWRYRDPGRALADRIGAVRATTVLARVGILQESLIADACRRIAEGEIGAALVVGGDGGHRLHSARAAGRELVDTQQESTPDVLLSPSGRITTEAEAATGLGEMAVGYYAIIDSAERAERGTSLDRHRDSIADLYSGFSQVAAGNPHAWKRSPLAPDAIRDGSDANPMIAFPYTRVHVSNWNVDQASALLLCSAAAATQAGVPPDSWIFPLASTLSEHMVPVSERALLHRAPGAEVAARRALDHAGVEPADLDFTDLYSCFPVAVRVHAAAAGIGLSAACTITGGMPFAGGPFNNYALHATAQLAHQLRRRPAATGLVSSVSGVLTKHGFAVWGSEPGAGYRFENMTAATAAQTATKPVVADHRGGGTIAGYTVTFRDGRPDRAVAVLDTDGGRRALAWSEDPTLLSDMVREEFCHRTVEVADGRFVPAARTPARETHG